MIISEEEFWDFANSYEGYCSSCEDFTRLTTEPDARNYDCPECGQNTVCGAEEALVEGLICIK